jgi:hypothetical protein
LDAACCASVPLPFHQTRFFIYLYPNGYCMDANKEIASELDMLVSEGTSVERLIQRIPAPFEFITSYQKWYTRALRVVSLLGTDRLDEFRGYYLADPDRKGLNYDTYTVQDYISGHLIFDFTNPPEICLNLAKIKFKTQLSILESLSSRIDNILSDVKGHLFVEMQDEELKIASQLAEINLRAAGAVSGVVLERHLQRVAVNHGIDIEKKNPTISDLNDPLRRGDVYDIPTWRQIQFLGDIRNLCVHEKEREPTVDEVKKLIKGTNEIIKTLF